EINTSFYQPLKLETAKQWVDLVSGNRSFVFTAKLWRRFTHDIAFTTSGSAEDERAVRAGFDVLCAAGKLGAVLLQFPFSFHRTKENMAYLSARSEEHRLNSSHVAISYAVFCLKKKKTTLPSHTHETIN